jgi:raffinose/stachyose/melibiose transport system substrate-binding protein
LAETPFFKSIAIGTLAPAGNTKDFMISRLQANICAASSRDKARQEGAIEFLKFLTKPANIKTIAESSGAMFAINTDYTPSDSLPKQFYDTAAKYTRTASDLEAALGAEVTLEFAQQLGALALGRISPAEFCALVDKKIER